MQGNGFKLAITVFFLALSGYYLYPSVQNYFLQRRIQGMEEQARADYERENFARISNVQEDALKLGLDLLGGMHVTLEVNVDALIRDLATDPDAAFDEVLAAAREEVATDDASLIDAFVERFEARDPDARLSRYFRDDDAGITRRSSNEEVAAYLQSEADEAVARAIEIIRQRVDRYGVTEPSIQRQGTRRIVVELPGVDDEERVRKLLRGTARLEFRLMAEPEALQRSLQRAIEYYESGATDVDALPVPDTADVLAEADTADVPANEQPVLTQAEPVADTAGALEAAPADTAEALAGTDVEGDSAFDVGSLIDGGEAASPLAGAGATPGNPLLEVMTPIGQGVQFGLVAEQDTAAANALLATPEVQALLPNGVELMYTAQPEGRTEGGVEVYALLGVRDNVELTGDVVTDASVDFDPLNQPLVSMAMNAEGARTWARITGANVNKQVAVVLDNVVYSYPVIRGRIAGGRTSIEGLDSRQEAQDIVTILKSGALPAPVDIIQERTVGPSLGAASIQAGFRSVLVGLLLVALFMIVYYRTAGVVADLALILNILFILGILAAFGATLTLPGIAGIVLTIGMAVDANVLIFERVREEQTTGKTLKAAIDGGYGKALSAIFDANITTFFVGAILYSFGSGPIQGFAVTLMAGIVASMFSAIVITRIVFDYMVSERRMRVSYG